MYESHFGLSAPPFQLNPDPAFYYDSRGHSHALAYLKYGVHQGEGFIVVTGEIGAGKTTVVRTLLESLDTSQVVAAQIVSTQLGPGDLLRAILLAYGVPVSQDSKPVLISTLEAFLNTLAIEGKRALLIVDEAQNLEPHAIEELRMLSNFQLGNRALLQSFLVGQPELRTLLKSKSMEQLRQRITASCHLTPLDCVDTRHYIEHRLNHVGWKGLPGFGVGACERIHHWTGGVPRRINRLCTRLLLGAYLQNVTEITEALVNDTAGELLGELGDFSEAAAHIPLQPDTAPVDALPRSSVMPVAVPPYEVTDATPGNLLCVCDCPTGFWKLATLAQVLADFAELPSLTLVHPGTEHATGAVTDRTLPSPFTVVHLRVEGSDYVQLTRSALNRFDILLSEVRPRAVIAVGVDDVVLACALLAKKRSLPVIRLDAGMHRAAGDGWQLNAMLLDRLANELFTQTEVHSELLLREGIAADRVQCMGSLVPKFVALAFPFMRDADKVLASFGIEAAALQGGYGLLSYRLSTAVDVLRQIEPLVPVLTTLARRMPLIWPLRPAERAALSSAGVEAELEQAGVMLVQDRGYTGSLNLLRYARCLIMGPEQALVEEAFALGKLGVMLGASHSLYEWQARAGARCIALDFDIELAAKLAREVMEGERLESVVSDPWDSGVAVQVAHRLRALLNGGDGRQFVSGLEVME